MEPLPQLNQTLAVTVNEASGVGDARRAAAELARRLGFDDSCTGRLAIIVTEAARNLVHHAGGGEVLLTRIGGHGREGVEVLAADRGPGMNDVARCLRNGYSSGPTPGTGLGAIRRLADGFDIHSEVGRGTILLGRVLSRLPAGARPRDPLMRIAGVSVRKPGQPACGDAWAARPHDPDPSILVADGLGHGREAAKASQQAARLFLEDGGEPEPLIHRMHESLRRLRGAAVALTRISPASRRLAFWGVGNVAGTVITPQGRSGLLSHHGTVGVAMPRLQGVALPWPEGAMLVMHSDGLVGRWDLSRYKGLSGRDPALIAGLLYRDFQRGNDDCTVVVTTQAVERVH